MLRLLKAGDLIRIPKVLFPFLEKNDTTSTKAPSPSWVVPIILQEAYPLYIII